MRTIILLLIIALVISCNKDDDFQPQTITPILISKGAVFNASSCTTSKQNLVFDNANDWQDFVENDWKISSPPPEASVDFNIHQVIVSIDEGKPTGGYEVTITSIIENKSNIVVNVAYEGEGDATQMPTCPYHFVKIPKSNKPIIFQ